MGHAYCALDAGGRLALPGFVRAALARRSDAGFLFVGRHEADPCLVSYDCAAARGFAEDRAQGVAAGAASAPGRHARLRRAFGFVEEVAIGPDGAVTVPPLLRRVARIGRSALVLGAGANFEIWNPDLAFEADDTTLSELAGFHLSQAA